ncbi:MAG: GNAT family N-acetyltransferase [Desulfomonilaceae bacterium]
MKPSFHRVDLASIDEEELDTFPGRIVFQTRPWVHFVARTQSAEPVVAALREDNETLGYFTGLIVKKFGFKILGSSFPGWSTPYMGFNLRPGVSRTTATEALTDFVFNDLKCHHMELMDRHISREDCAHLDLECLMFDCFELDISLTEGQIWKSMRPDCRQCIRKAEKSGVEIEEASDLMFADEHYAQLKHVFAVKNSVPPFGVERVKRLIEVVYPSGNLLMLRARNKEGICIATSIFAAMNQIVFGWGAASWRHFSQVRPYEMLIWYAIKYWKERGISTLELVGRGDYKLKFGSRPIVIPRLRKSRNRAISFLRNSAETVLWKAQHTVGKLAHVADRLRNR